MNKASVRWILAILITLSAAFFQRMTGPTYPLRGKIEIENQEYKYRLLRSHGGETDQPVEFSMADTSFNCYLIHKRFKTDDSWTKTAMAFKDGTFHSTLPHQPPAGKLEYFISIEKNGESLAVPADQTVVTRFKGAVPLAVLIPHVLFMFIAMLLSNVSGLEAIASGPKIKPYTLITVVCLFLGGMILGPIVQKYAFGAYWTGFPFGGDLTDNKTLFAMIGWFLALWRISADTIKKSRWWVVGAALVLLLIYSIPHSTMGSEFDYKKMEVVTGRK